MRRLQCRNGFDRGRASSGAAIIEFALALPVLLFLMFSVIEVGWMFLGNIELRNAIDVTGRKIRTGQFVAGGQPTPDLASIRNEICNNIGVLSDCRAELRIELRGFENYAWVSSSYPVDNEGNLGDIFIPDALEANRIVLLTAYYPWPLLNVIPNPSLADKIGGHQLLQATALFKNEPF